MAFQIVDDLLDYVGDPHVTGKPTGSDLREHKLTLPLIHALNKRTPADADALRAVLRSPDPDRRTKVTDALIESGSLAYAKRRAEEFARNGFDLVLSADDDALDAAAEAERAHGRRAWSVRGDLATYPGVTELVERIEELDRPVDVLVLNAGVGVGGPFVGDTPLHDQLRVVDLNVSGTLHLAKRLLPAMVERGRGRLVVVSSTVAMAARWTAPVSPTTTSSTRSGRCGQAGPCTGVICQARASAGAPVPPTFCHPVSMAAPALVTFRAYSAPSATPNRSAATVPELGGAGATTGPGGRPFVVLGVMSVDAGR